METKTFKAGEVIFHEGDKAREAYRIVTGRVAISIAGATKPLILALLDSGDIFGEMGLIDDRPRSATALAIEDLNVERVTLSGFHDMVLNDPKRLIPFLSVFFERLRTSNDRLRKDLKDTNVAMPTDPELLKAQAQEIKRLADRSTIELIPSTNVARDGCGSARIAISRFPYRIGRIVVGDRKDPFNVNDLALPDNEPYDLSKNHCSIDRAGDLFFVHDRGSDNGTIVNHVRIGNAEPEMTARLKKGENHITLGPDKCPFQFRVDVPG